MLAATPDQVWRTVGDPSHLARWWPKVLRVEAIDGQYFTEVLQTDRGRPVRADWFISESREPELWACEQTVEGTPFEGVLAASLREVRLQPAGDEATVATVMVDRRMRGLARASAMMMRRATSRQIEAALDKLVLLHGEARIT